MGCKCMKKKGIDYYQHVKIDKHMGFVDCDVYEFEPAYCPHCGVKKDCNKKKEKSDGTKLR